MDGEGGQEFRMLEMKKGLKMTAVVLRGSWVRRMAAVVVCLSSDPSLDFSEVSSLYFSEDFELPAS
jgi:hypothetical protein